MDIEIGSDLIEIHRVKRLLNKAKFVNRIYTEKELEYINKKSNCKSKSATAAGIFAAKEAVSKSLGTGISGIKWKDIEITHNDRGKPLINLYGNARRLLEDRKIELSISHNESLAIAQAIVYRPYDDRILGKKQTNENLKYKEEIELYLPKRKRNTHKGDYGKVGIIAGSLGMAGAPCLSSFSALRIGSGLVYTYVPEKIHDVVSNKSLENIVIPISDDNRGYFLEKNFDDVEDLLKKLDSIAIGPGLGRNHDTLGFVRRVIDLNIPTVVDADGITLIAQDKSILTRNSKIILTPHTAEFSRISGIAIEEIESNREYYAKEFVKKFDLVLVLKGANTIVIDRENIYVNNTGNPGMATAGSGDVLTGIILSLKGQGLSEFDAARLGVYIHGMAGDLVANELGEYGMIASDIINELPYVTKLLIERI